MSDIKKHDITESMRLEYSAAPFRANRQRGDDGLGVTSSDDERAISYELAGRHEVSSEEPSQNKEGQKTQQQLGLLLEEISVLQQEQAADRKLIEVLNFRIQHELIFGTCASLALLVLLRRYLALIDTIPSSNVQTLQARMCVR